jgi:acetyl esterase/lipase
VRSAVIVAALSTLIASDPAGARSPEERLKDAHLEAVRAQRIEWKMRRAAISEPEGVYRDFRAIFLPTLSQPTSTQADSLVYAARAAEVQIIIGTATTGKREDVLFLDHAPNFQGLEIHHPSALKLFDWKRLNGKLLQYPYEVLGATVEQHPEILVDWDRQLATNEIVGYARTTLPDVKLSLDAKAAALRTTTTHVLARELKESDVIESLAAGHAYVSHDWLCDPTGFSFVAENYFGAFEMGDTVVANPLMGETTITASVPVTAKMRLLRNGNLVAEARDNKLVYRAVDEGAYRLEASLAVDGEDRPWIYSNALYIRKPWDIRLPGGETPADVEVRNDISYVDDAARDGRQRLDLYLPKGKSGFPVVLFVHGGGWISGDRALYRALGNRLAHAGIGVAIPSYRLMPRNPHPAQVEDVAAAFAWVRANIGQYGGDTSRFYVSGHSSGGHLVSLLALDDQYLKSYNLDPSAIKGVISISGVYNVDHLLMFTAKGERRDASPLHHVHRDSPRFLISYCQWDYLGLPRQARNFAEALKKAFVPTELIYIPHDNHITEIINATKEDGPLLRALLNFIR